MNVDWSELAACRGCASAVEVPKAIETLFSDSPQERQQAYWKIDNYVVVQGGLFESAAYAARILVDKIKANPEKLSVEILDLLFELANGNAGGQSVEHGPLKGQAIERLCRDTVAEVLPVIVAARANPQDRYRTTIQDILEIYDGAKD